MFHIARSHFGKTTFFLEDGVWDQSHILVGLFAGNVNLRSRNKPAFDDFEGNKAIFVKRDIR